MPALGPWGNYQAVEGICAAFSRLEGKSIKQYDTVNMTTGESFTHYFRAVKVCVTMVTQLGEIPK